MTAAGDAVGLLDAVGAALGTKVVSNRTVGGGDINDAHAMELADGRQVFVKTHARPPAGMYTAEARGLSWLAEPDVVRVPKVLAVEEGGPRRPSFLVLEMIEPGRRRSDFDEALGRALAALHRSGAPTFGLDHDNFIGNLPQENRPASDWPSFYHTRRLEPLVRRAADRRLLSVPVRHELDKLFAALPRLVGPAEPPARLHGDLWGGNLHVDERGDPCLIDPAVYGGHREIDLAMMRLFGGFSDRVFSAYDEAYPLADGWLERVPLYQLYPLLVHVNLFGGSYVRSVERALSQLV